MVADWHGFATRVAVAGQSCLRVRRGHHGCAFASKFLGNCESQTDLMEKDQLKERVIELKVSLKIFKYLISDKIEFVYGRSAYKKIEKPTWNCKLGTYLRLNISQTFSMQMNRNLSNNVSKQVPK